MKIKEILLSLIILTLIGILFVPQDNMNIASVLIVIAALLAVIYWFLRKK